jgi:glyceraldehyde 3-phosphate dehydrogenase
VPIKIGINGFGRIGRQVYKALRERYDKEIDVVAVNDIGRINIMAHLLRHKQTDGSVRVADLAHFVARQGL